MTISRLGRLIVLALSLMAGQVVFGQTLGSIDGEAPDSTGASNGIILTPQAFSMRFDRRTPYSNQYLVNIQRELEGNLVFEVGYFGSLSRHLESYRGISAAVPGPGTVASRSSYPNFGLLVQVDDGANGNYNSMSSKSTKRFSHGVTAPVAYTWSKSIDETSGVRTEDSDSLFSRHKSFRMPKEGHVLQFRWEALNSGLQRGEKCA